ncbi:MAG: hypothetical protein AAGU76_10030 [Sedimentibacter sp.]|uniref:hypothetical protein n=1 Tax=Sedimentibacter sp. TaxID=1960295 RepID=UPI0031584D64
MKTRKKLRTATLMIGILLSFTACGQNSKIEEIPNQSLTEEKNIVSLQFKDYILNNNITEIVESKVVEIIERYSVNDADYIIFINEDDKDNLHSGVLTNNKIYDFQTVSILEQTNYSELFSLQEIDLFGKQLVKIQGILGANYSPSNYYYIEKQVPRLFLHSEGHTFEDDLDDDGIQDIVSVVSGGVTTDIDIYKYNDDKLSAANLNEALNAVTVLYNQDDKTFEVYFVDQPNAPKYYELTKEGLKEAIKP